MGVRTFAVFKSDLDVALGGGHDDTWLGNRVNDGYLDTMGVLERDDHKATANFSSVKDQNNYTIGGSNFLYLTSMTDLDNKTNIRYLALRNFNAYDPETTGLPRYVTIRANEFLLWPTPDGIYDIHYEFYTESLALSGVQTTSLPNTFDRAVGLAALHHALMDLDELERAAAVYNRFNTYMRSRLDQEDYAQGRPSVGVNVATREEDLRRMHTS